jgi:hypothetical protein
MPRHVTLHPTLGQKSLCVRPRSHSDGRAASPTSGLVSPGSSGDSTTYNVAQQVAFLRLPQMDGCPPNAVDVMVLRTRQVVLRGCSCPISFSNRQPWRRGSREPVQTWGTQQRTGGRPKLCRGTSLPSTPSPASPSLAVAHDTSLFYRSAHCDHSPDNRVEPS